MFEVSKIEVAAFYPEDKNKLAAALKEIAELFKHFEVRIRMIEERLNEVDL